MSLPVERFKELKLSPNLKSIGLEGLYYCKRLETIYFPSTLETLGAESCEYWKNVKSIYCAAKIPPVCIDSEINPGSAPFGDYGDDFVNRTPQETLVYVPIGSAELYRCAWGWNYFTNFIETDNFPSSGIDSVVIDGKEDNVDYYDLFGRKVNTLIPRNIYISNGKKFIHH